MCPKKPAGKSQLTGQNRKIKHQKSTSNAAISGHYTVLRCALCTCAHVQPKITIGGSGFLNTYKAECYSAVPLKKIFSLCYPLINKEKRSSSPSVHPVGLADVGSLQYKWIDCYYYSYYTLWRYVYLLLCYNQNNIADQGYRKGS
jgi:hypothetical protein